MAKREYRERAGKGRRPRRKVGEANIAYIAEGPERMEAAVTRLSGKNQITLPAAMCRDLNLRPGDEIELRRQDGTILLERLPRTPEEWVDYYAGSVRAPEWSSREKIDAWLRGERESWERGWPDDKPPLPPR